MKNLIKMAVAVQLILFTSLSYGKTLYISDYDQEQGTKLKVEKVGDKLNIQICEKVPEHCSDIGSYTEAQLKAIEENISSKDFNKDLYLAAAMGVVNLFALRKASKSTTRVWGSATQGYEADVTIYKTVAELAKHRSFMMKRELKINGTFLLVALGAKNLLLDNGGDIKSIVAQVEAMDDSPGSETLLIHQFSSSSVANILSRAK